MKISAHPSDFVVSHGNFDADQQNRGIFKMRKYYSTQILILIEEGDHFIFGEGSTRKIRKIYDTMAKQATTHVSTFTSLYTIYTRFIHALLSTTQH